MTPWVCLAALLPLAAPEPAWVNSTIGTPDPELVPPPFRQVERTASARGLAFSVVGRVYQFDAQPLPTAITSRGESLLRGPVTLAAEAADGPLEWRWGTPTLGEKHAGWATWTGGGDARGWHVDVSGRCDYDGLLLLDLDLTPPANGATLNRLELRVPLRPDRALYRSYWPGTWGNARNSGALEPEGLALPFKPLLWLGDNDRGLSVCAESDEGWHPADEQHVLTVGPAADRTVVVHLIGRPTAVQGGWHTRLMLHPTPMKPMPRDPHYLHLNHGGSFGMETAPYHGTPARLVYDASKVINPAHGTLEAWLSPGFDPNRPLTEAEKPGRGAFNRDFAELRLADGTTAGFYWNVDDRGMRFYVKQGDQFPLVFGAPMPWKQGEAHQVALAWGDAIRLYNDGKLCAERPFSGLFGRPVDLKGATLTIGGNTATFALHALRLDDVTRSEFLLTRAPVRDEHTTLLEVGKELGQECKREGCQLGSGKFGDAVYFYDPQLQNPTLLDALQSAGVRTLIFHESWADVQNTALTSHGDQLKALTTACHDRNLRLLVYFGYEMADIVPEWGAWADRCLVMPRQGGYKRQPAQTDYIVCYNSPWQNYVLESIAKAVDVYGVDGVYLDGTIEPFGCTNEKHGCGYVGADGKRHPTYPILAVRRMMERMYTLLAARRQPDVLIDAHQSLCMMSPTLSWCSGYWDGEQLTSSYEAGRKPLEYLPLATFRAEFMGRQWGIPAMFLNYEGKPFQPREAMAFSLLHDVLPRGSGMNAVQGLVTPVWRALDAFGRANAQFIGYWTIAPLVVATPETVKASAYVQPNKAMLLVVSNLGDAACDAAVTLHETALPGKLSAKDAITGDAVPLDGRTLKLALDSLDYRLIEVRPAK